MEVKEILSKCDHTLLAQTATWKESRASCDDGMKYGCASVCIPASYVKQAAEYVAGKLPICTVSGCPHGYDTTAAKCFMATDAVENGAEEVDMVINLGWVKDQKWDDLLAEIKAVKAACKASPFSTTGSAWAVSSRRHLRRSSGTLSRRRWPLCTRFSTYSETSAGLSWR